jgi:cytochrome oxidase assembly protein ShyY1
MSAAVLTVLPALLALGSWQLDRAAEKRSYLTSFIEAQGALPRAADGDPAPAAFERVRLAGRFESGRQFLLDNQVRDGRVGYWVVTPFVDQAGQRWLVNRGWIAAGATREALPDIAVSGEPAQIVAVVWPDMGLPPLAGEDNWGSGWPRRVQRLELARMAEALGGALPLQLRLEAGQRGSLAPAPLELTLRPETHTGYAVQWFLMAAVLLIAYGLYGFGFTLTGKNVDWKEDSRP